MKPLRIVLVDDHPIVLQGMRALLASEPDLEVVGEAQDGAAALRLTAELHPDVVVMDVAMPGRGGAATARELHAGFPAVRVLALSVHENPGYLRLLLDAGACGYVVKRAVPGELVHAIRTVAAGTVYIDPRLAYRIASGLIQRHPAKVQPGASDLSVRETEVLRLIALGYESKEIGALLHISSKTVHTYRARAMEKLDLHARTDVLRYAMQRGWLDSL